MFGADDPGTAGTTYNLACVAARAGKKEQALALLRDAMTHGFGADVAGAMGKDTDLAGLQGEAGFAEIVEEGKKRGNEVKK